MIVLTKDQLKVQVPSAFSDHPVQEVSNKYQFISTNELINSLADLNWFPVSAKQDKPSKQEPVYCKHMIKFQNPDISSYKGIIPEFVWLNSHNRSFRAVGALGAFRLYCWNGLIVPIVEMFRVNAKHMGNISDIGSSIIQMVQNSDGVFRRIDDYENIILNQQEKEKFAYDVLKLNWKEQEVSFNLNQMLIPKRTEDSADNLWNVFNVLQENITKGGMAYRMVGVNGKMRKAKTRGIKEVRRDFNVNVGLWNLMEDIRTSRMS